MPDAQERLGYYQAEARVCMKILGPRILSRLVCTYQLPCPYISSSSPSGALAKGASQHRCLRNLVWATEFRRKSCPTDCAQCPDAAVHFCQSKAQAQAPSNRSHLLQKNSSVLLAEVGFHLNLDLKEPILSFSSFSESSIFHPRSFPVPAQKLALPCSALILFANSACMELEGQIRAPLCKS